MTETRACIRGCASPRQHLTDCTDETCTGCLPRRAEHGQLCHSCHAKLRDLVVAIGVQHQLLQVTAGALRAQSLTAETVARTIQQPRTSSSQPQPSSLYAKAITASAAESEPVRVAALDCAQELADWLSCVVEAIVSDHQLRGPVRLRPSSEGIARKWRPVDGETGRPARRHEQVVTYRDDREQMSGQYVYLDEPVRFEVQSAAKFLNAWLDRFEVMDSVGDDLELLREIMSRAHALAPWREEAARITNVPCPSCSRKSMMRFGGGVIQCTTPWCRTTVDEDRFGIWSRMLEEEREGA